MGRPADIEGVRSSSRLREISPSLIVFTVAIAITILAVFATWETEQETRARALGRDGDLVTRLLSETMGLGVTQVRSIQAFFMASDEITAIEFSRFTLHQGRSPGMVTLGYAPVVDPAGLEPFRLQAAEDRPQYTILDSDRRIVTEPDPTRDLVPVWYSHQHEILPSILGVDLASDPDRRDAIDRALDTGDPAVTRPIRMLGQPDSAFVEIYAPVRSGLAEYRGVVFASIRIEDLVDMGPRQAFTGREIDIADVTDAPPSDLVSDSHRWSDRVPIGDRTWEVTLHENAAEPASPILIMVVASGGALALLAALITYMVVSSRRRKREISDLIRATHDKDVFLASVAHELRTPLTSVVGITALLADGWETLEKAEVTELLQVTHTESSELADLIQDLLVAGRLEAGVIHCRAEAVDLYEEVKKVVARVNTDLTVSVDLEAGGQMVHADPLRVRQIVRNIVANAVRHGSNTVTVDADVSGHLTILRIRNDGGPVPDHLAEVLFEPYQLGRERDHQGSIGLGLPISRQLARLMEGDLEYAYEEGWATFSLSLPTMPATAEGSRLAPQTTTQTRSPSSAR